MRTVSTKLDKKEHEQLVEMCNDYGQSVSEALREMIQSYHVAWEEGKEIEKEEKLKESESNNTTTKPILTLEDGKLWYPWEKSEDGTKYKIGIGDVSKYELTNGKV